MDNTNIEYLLNIFKELTTELPKELIYRETDDFFELKSLDAAQRGGYSNDTDNGSCKTCIDYTSYVYSDLLPRRLLVQQHHIF